MTDTDPNRESQARGGALSLLIAQVVWTASQWLLLVAATHWTAASLVGTYALALGTSTPIFRFFNSGLRLYAAADVNRRFGHREYLRGRLAGLCAATLASVLVWWLHSGFSAVALLLAVAATKAIDGLSDLSYGFAQREGRFARVATSLIARGTLGLAMAVAALALTGSLPLAVLGAGGAWLIVFVALDAGALKDSGGSESIGGATSLARRVAPLAFVAALSSAFAYIPVYFLSVQSSAMAGIFAALNYPALGLVLFGVAWGQANTPRFARLSEQTAGFRVELYRGMRIMAALTAAGFTLSWLLGPWAVELVYGPPYTDYAGAMPWLFLAAGVGNVSTILSYAGTAIGRIAWQPVLVLLAMIVVASLASYLIPNAPITGAGVAVCCGYALHAAVMAGYVLRPK